MGLKYSVQGIVYDKDKMPASNRTVHIYDRNTGEKIRTAKTDITGKFESIVGDDRTYMVVAMPLDGENSNARIFDRVISTADTLNNINKIGTPGTQGFGIGICPDTPDFMEPLPGFDDPSHENYGNYRVVSDGSIMCWIPAFYYKWGTGSNGVTLNDCSIANIDDYVDEAAANADGFALHRAFIDGGVIQPGFFIDKYKNSKHPTLNVVSSLKMATPINSTQYSLVGAANTIGAAVDAARLRGAGFFCNSIFTSRAVSLLSYAHGRASSSTTNCGWYGASNNFPKGNINSATSTAPGSPTETGVDFRGILSASVSIIYTGSFYNMTKNTHNGQLCGITDVTGNVSETAMGFTYFSTGDQFRLLKESQAMKDMTYVDLWNVANAATLYDNVGATLSDFSTTNGWVYYTNTNQIFSEATDRTTTDYKMTNIGICKPGVFSTTNPNYMGSGTYRSKLNQMCALVCGNYNDQANAGPWSLFLNYSANSVVASMGLRSALYL